MVYLLIVFWQLAVKRSGEGSVSFTETFSLLDFEFSVPNNHDIDGVAGHFAQFLNLV